MPKGLQGKANQTDEGNRICYGFNLGTCPSKVAPGGKCERGLHVCANKGCFGPHPVRDCTH